MKKSLPLARRDCCPRAGPGKPVPLAGGNVIMLDLTRANLHSGSDPSTYLATGYQLNKTGAHAD